MEHKQLLKTRNKLHKLHKNGQFNLPSKIPNRHPHLTIPMPIIKIPNHPDTLIKNTPTKIPKYLPKNKKESNILQNVVIAKTNRE